MEIPIKSGLLLRTRNENTGYRRALNTLAGQILSLKAPPCEPTEIATDRSICRDRRRRVRVALKDDRRRYSELEVCRKAVS
jgi:hypothetical protein